ncbi:MAG: polymer-forming cytoskeletal protein [candidate division NC10 bacterium]|nr:polymer-forming cytoskeletal protein [candidate division NC10 bacterium]MCH7895849.1 polymer-forming cytoskeletal protein [candidate division NC10 bacterium]MCZ6550091.1 polymer-forming cytoskeletal protein [candidate division NC10 bacterium]
MAFIFGKGLILRGKLEGEGDLQVQGHLEGKISLTGTVVVLEGASVQGDISANEIIVAGVVRGNLTASGKVELAPTGHLLGDVRSKQLIVREGAALNGSISVETPLSPAGVFAEMARLMQQEETPEP